MADYDLFDLLGLPFYPPEKNAKKVFKAIENIKKELNGLLGIETQQLKREELNKKLVFLDSISSTIFDNDGNLTHNYQTYCDKKLNDEIKKLSDIASLLKNVDSNSVTSGTINIYHQTSKLSKDNVKNVFINHGFTINEIDPFRHFPKFPVRAEEIYSELEALRNIKDPNPNGPDVTLVCDLYAFVAYLGAEPENCNQYRLKSTNELFLLLESSSKRLSVRNDELGKLCASLATASKTYVFDSEENRESYDKFLKFKSPYLIELFSKIKKIPRENLLDIKLAEGCIKEISNIFYDYNISLAIYNKVAGLKDNPYIPVKPRFFVKCGSCQSLCEFENENEAKTNDKCKNCGNSLYKKCGNCNESVISLLEKCPKCGYIFNSSGLFDKYIQLAEQAFKSNDIDTANFYIIQAKYVTPNDKKALDDLINRINYVETENNLLKDNIEKLIKDKKFQLARKTITDIKNEYSGIDLSYLDSKINDALSHAQNIFDESKTLSPSEQANKCVLILRDCIDFEPANTFLETTPPKSCDNFSINLDEYGYQVNISWSHSSEIGVTYRLVRKIGEEFPTSKNDGIVIIDNFEDTMYKDTDVNSGETYSYAVFAIRLGNFSKGKGGTVSILSEVTNFTVTQIDQTVRLTWITPKNSMGVSIFRSDGQNKLLLATNSYDCFDDTDVKFGLSYSYKLCVNYPNLPQSQGVYTFFSPNYPLQPFTIFSKPITGNLYTFSHDIEQKNINVRALVDNEVVREFRSNLGNIDLTLPIGGVHTIYFSAFSIDKWIHSSNIISINTSVSCSINANSSYIHEYKFFELSKVNNVIEFHLKINESIPANVIGFYYAIRSDISDNCWVEEEDVYNAQDIYKIPIKSYYQKNEMYHYLIANEESFYYISLFTVYNIAGKEFVSSPTRFQYERVIDIDLIWELKLCDKNSIRLILDFSGNRPFSQIPTLALCACSQDKFLKDNNDPHICFRKYIKVDNLKYPQKNYNTCYLLSSNFSKRELKRLKFFLFPVYELTSSNRIKCTTRWATKFSGSIR
jgi:hypothetical protein